MALIKCPACRRKVSTDAKSCPGCGDPLTPLSQHDQAGGPNSDGGGSFFKTAFYALCFIFGAAWLLSDDTEDFLGFVNFYTGIELRNTIEVSKLYRVTASTLNQRNCGSPGCSIVGKLNRGDIVRAYDVRGRWVRVSESAALDDEKWVAAQYLKEEPRPVAQQ